MKKEELEELKKKRFQFLQTLYELAEGSELNVQNMWKIGENLGFDRSLTDNITVYLVHEGLVEWVATGGPVKISHQGVREVEEAIANPDKATEHFPPINFIAVGQMINSQIQQASPSASQKFNINADKYGELKEIIQSLKESVAQLNLQSPQLSDIQAEIQTIEAQMMSSKPKNTVLVECIHTIRNILESAAGSILASEFISRLASLLK